MGYGKGPPRCEKLVVLLRQNLDVKGEQRNIIINDTGIENMNLDVYF